MRRIAKKQIDLEQREQFDMMRSNNHHNSHNQWDMRNTCNGGYVDDYEVFKNGPFQR